MSRKEVVKNEVNNFASDNIEYCGKSKHFVLDLEISPKAATLVIYSPVLNKKV